MTQWLRVVSMAFALWMLPQLGAAQAPRAAEDPAPTDAAEDRAASFREVKGGVREDVPGGPLLVIAYALVWVAVLGYVFRLARLQKGVDENLARLEHDLAKATQGSGQRG